MRAKSLFALLSKTEKQQVPLQGREHQPTTAKAWTEYQVSVFLVLLREQ